MPFGFISYALAPVLGSIFANVLHDAIFLSSKRIVPRILQHVYCGRVHMMVRHLHNGRMLCLHMNLVLLSVQYESDYTYRERKERVCILRMLYQYSKLATNMRQ